MFLKECKYIEKEMILHITEDVEIFSSNSDELQIKTKYHLSFEKAILMFYDKNLSWLWIGVGGDFK